MPYYYSASIFSRFRITLFNHDQADADRFFKKASELVLDVEREFESELMEFEVFLLAGVLSNMREIDGLRKAIAKLGL